MKVYKVTHVGDIKINNNCWNYQVSYNKQEFHSHDNFLWRVEQGKKNIS